MIICSHNKNTLWFCGNHTFTAIIMKQISIYLNFQGTTKLYNCLIKFKESIFNKNAIKLIKLMRLTIIL